MAIDGRDSLGNEMGLELDTLDLKIVQTELEACPSCVYSPDGGSCDRRRFTFNFPVCINYAPEDANEQYLKQNCEGCKQRDFGCVLADALVNGGIMVTQLSVDEGYLMCPKAHGEIPNGEREAINNLFRTLLDK